MATCATCSIQFDDPEEFRHHCKDLWHTYNLKRKVAGLGPISQAQWAEKCAAADQLAQSNANAKGKGKGKGKGKKAERQPKPAPKPETPWTHNQCLFDDHVCPTVEENVAYMASKYSFFVPDREYLVKPLEMLSMLHEKIYEDSTCIFCNKIFASSQDVLKHMKDLGHTRIGTGTDILRGELEPFYDFSNSKSELVTKAKQRVKAKDADESTSPTDESEPGENDVASEGGEWEDCDDDDVSDDGLEVVECEDEDEFEAVLAEYGLQRTEVLASGDLRLPNGAVATHRKFAYVYKQRFRPSQQVDPVQKRLALSMAGFGRPAVGGGGGRGFHGALAVAVGSRMVKTHQRQVVAILREQQRQHMKLGIHHNTSNMFKHKRKVQVNLYTWAK